MKFPGQITKRGEILVYAIIWLVVFLMPVFISYSDYGYNWQRTGLEWLRVVPFCLIFLFHNFLFFPRYFEKDKRVVYFVLTIATVLIISGLWIFIGQALNSSVVRMPLPRGEMLPGPHNPPGQINPWYINMVNNVLVSVLVIGFNAAIKLMVKWQKEEQKNRILEKEKLQAELAFLRNQVSPHFFMNTLNNIHALIDIDTEDAKESIVKLSRMMRYLLYDSERGKTTLETELEFIKGYVELMKLRLLPNVEITLSFPEDIPGIQIPPLLFISLIENAFKYGISYREKSFIVIELKVEKDSLDFKVRNSLHQHNLQNEAGGIGLTNMRKRLELLFGTDFVFTADEKEHVFEARVIIPTNGN